MVLVVDQLSPHRDLAPMQDSLCLFHFSTLSYTQRSQEKCILMPIEVSIADGHELNTAYVGGREQMPSRQMPILKPQQWGQGSCYSTGTRLHCQQSVAAGRRRVEG